MELINTRCNNCGKAFDHYESFYTDICNPCTESTTGKTISQLEAEDARYDDVEAKSHGTD